MICSAPFCDENYSRNDTFLQFVIAALPWVTLGTGIACIAAAASGKKKIGK